MFQEEEENSDQVNTKVDTIIWIVSQGLIILIAILLFARHRQEKKKFQKQLYDFSYVQDNDIQIKDKSKVVPDYQKPLIYND